MNDNIKALIEVAAQRRGNETHHAQARIFRFPLHFLERTLKPNVSWSAATWKYTPSGRGRAERFCRSAFSWRARDGVAHESGVTPPCKKGHKSGLWGLPQGLALVTVVYPARFFKPPGSPWLPPVWRFPHRSPAPGDPPVPPVARWIRPGPLFEGKCCPPSPL